MILNTLRTLLIVTMGVIFMTLLAFKKIPIPATPIQMSLQSLSISILVITLGKKACWVVLLYLILATLGFPVLPDGAVNSSWYLLPTAGYYAGFLISSYFLAKILIAHKPQSFFKSWLVFSLNESLILLCGYIVLCFYFGVTQSWWMGVWPYIIGAILKITIATCIYISCFSGRRPEKQV